MVVVATTTLNFSFGNGISVPEAGFLLNNEIDDFTAKPESPNANSVEILLPKAKGHLGAPNGGGSAQGE